jgi:hypothetical protein
LDLDADGAGQPGERPLPAQGGDGDAHGRFWQQESYDHWVRDVEELERIVLYIEQNPVRAGLAGAPELWPYGSAHGRCVLGLAPGLPLLRAR